MSTTDRNDTGLILAMLGAGALSLWFLWRGIGIGRGTGQPGSTDSVSAPTTMVVRIRGGDRIELDGVDSDLATTVARARAAGAALVVATGDARHGWVEAVRDALHRAGVKVAMRL